MKEKRNSFSKKERLTGKITIERLFASGKSFFVYPFLIQYEEISEPRPVSLRILISVSKRKFKHAVDRNAIKRQIREAYRLMKNKEFEPLQEKRLNIGVIYVGRDKSDSKKLRTSLLRAFTKLMEELDD